MIYGPPQAYDVSYPFKLGRAGAVKCPSAIFASPRKPACCASKSRRRLRSAGFSGAGLGAGLGASGRAWSAARSLAPLERISAQFDRISRGEFDQKPLERADEFGQVSTKISQIGQQLRGVREIFSTLRENLDQVLGGLEDGLLLFTRDGRAVMVSPAVENFLGRPPTSCSAAPPARFSRRAIPCAPLWSLPAMNSSRSRPRSRSLPAADPGLPPQRIGVSVQLINEGGTRMGALVTLRDLESLETISRQLQVSERLAALGRVTAGVAHEVKNPLNSMRLWLENLKENSARRRWRAAPGRCRAR